jgi:hypothetical protein
MQPEGTAECFCLAGVYVYMSEAQGPVVVQQARSLLA